MEVFSYHPSGPETIEAFNARLAKFSEAEPITGVISSEIAGAIVLSIATAEDVFSSLVLQPVVVPLPVGCHIGLEKMLTSVLDQIKARHNDQVQSNPVEIRVINYSGGVSIAGYAVFLVHVGDLETTEG